MKNKSDILKHIKIKLLHGTEDASKIMVSLSEIDRFHSDIAFRQFYQTEYPERHATMKEIDRVRFEYKCFIREALWR